MADIIADSKNTALHDVKPDMPWYAVQVRTGREQRAKLFLREMILREDSKSKSSFGAVFVPTKRVIEMRKSRKFERTMVLYPGYLFVQLDYGPNAHRMVKNAPEVRDFVRPVQPIASIEMDKLFHADSDQPTKVERQTSQFQVGDSVRIISGPFNEYSGQIIDVIDARQKLRVHVMIFQRPTPVELDFAQVIRE